MKKQMLFISTMLIVALGGVSLNANNNGTGFHVDEERIIIHQETEDPLEESLDLVVYYNTTTGQISVETYVNQWIWVYIMDAQTGAVFSVDVIDPSYNYGDIYHTYAPSAAGEYCILFQSNSAEAYGYFSVSL